MFPYTNTEGADPGFEGDQAASNPPPQVLRVLVNNGFHSGKTLTAQLVT